MAGSHDGIKWDRTGAVSIETSLVKKELKFT